MSTTYRLLITALFFVAPCAVEAKNGKNRQGAKQESGVLVEAPSKQGTEKLIERVYSNLSGFNQLPAQELEFITKKSGEKASTYGEITYNGWQEILDDLNLGSDAVFYDLGCGVGKVVVQAYFNSQVKEAKGIELCETRYKQALEAKQRLQDLGLLDKNRKLVFEYADITDADLSNATVLFTCSTCFSEEVMTKLMNKVAQLKPGTRFLSLKQLPEGYADTGLELVKEYNVKMSWTPQSTSPVYLYRVMTAEQRMVQKIKSLEEQLAAAESYITDLEVALEQALTQLEELMPSEEADTNELAAEEGPVAAE